MKHFKVMPMLRILLMVTVACLAKPSEADDSFIMCGDKAFEAFMNCMTTIAGNTIFSNLPRGLLENFYNDMVKTQKTMKDSGSIGEITLEGAMAFTLADFLRKVGNSGNKNEIMINIVRGCCIDVGIKPDEKYMGELKRTFEMKEEERSNPSNAQQSKDQVQFYEMPKNAYSTSPNNNALPKQNNPFDKWPIYQQPQEPVFIQEPNSNEKNLDAFAYNSPTFHAPPNQQPTSQNNLNFRNSQERQPLTNVDINKQQYNNQENPNTYQNYPSQNVQSSNYANKFLFLNNERNGEPINLQNQNPGTDNRQYLNDKYPRNQYGFNNKEDTATSNNGQAYKPDLNYHPRNTEKAAFAYADNAPENKNVYNPTSVDSSLPYKADGRYGYGSSSSAVASASASVDNNGGNNEQNINLNDKPQLDFRQPNIPSTENNEKNGRFFRPNFNYNPQNSGNDVFASSGNTPQINNAYSLTPFDKSLPHKPDGKFGDWSTYLGSSAASSSGASSSVDNNGGNNAKNINLNGKPQLDFRQPNIPSTENNERSGQFFRPNFNYNLQTSGNAGFASPGSAHQINNVYSLTPFDPSPPYKPDRKYNDGSTYLGSSAVSSSGASTSVDYDGGNKEKNVNTNDKPQFDSRQPNIPSTEKNEKNSQFFRPNFNYNPQNSGNPGFASLGNAPQINNAYSLTPFDPSLPYKPEGKYSDGSTYLGSSAVSSSGYSTSVDYDGGNKEKNINANDKPQLDSRQPNIPSTENTENNGPFFRPNFNYNPQNSGNAGFASPGNAPQINNAYSRTPFDPSLPYKPDGKYGDGSTYLGSSAVSSSIASTSVDYEGGIKEKNINTNDKPQLDSRQPNIPSTENNEKNGQFFRQNFKYNPQNSENAGFASPGNPPQINNAYSLKPFDPSLPNKPDGKYGYGFSSSAVASASTSSSVDNNGGNNAKNINLNGKPQLDFRQPNIPSTENNEKNGQFFRPNFNYNPQNSGNAGFASAGNAPQINNAYKPKPFNPSLSYKPDAKYGDESDYLGSSADASSDASSSLENVRGSKTKFFNSEGKPQVNAEEPNIPSSENSEKNDPVYIPNFKYYPENTANMAFAFSGNAPQDNRDYSLTSSDSFASNKAKEKNGDISDYPSSSAVAISSVSSSIDKNSENKVEKYTSNEKPQLYSEQQKEHSPENNEKNGQAHKPNFNYNSQNTEVAAFAYSENAPKNNNDYSLTFSNPSVSYKPEGNYGYSSDSPTVALSGASSSIENAGGSKVNFFNSEDKPQLNSKEQYTEGGKKDKMAKFYENLNSLLCEKRPFKRVFHTLTTYSQVLNIIPYVLSYALLFCGYPGIIAREIAKGSSSFMEKFREGSSTEIYAEGISNMLMTQLSSKNLIEDDPEGQAKCLGNSIPLILHTIGNPKVSTKIQNNESDKENKQSSENLNNKNSEVGHQNTISFLASSSSDIEKNSDYSDTGRENDDDYDYDFINGYDFIHEGGDDSDELDGSGDFEDGSNDERHNVDDPNDGNNIDDPNSNNDDGDNIDDPNSNNDDGDNIGDPNDDTYPEYEYGFGYNFSGEDDNLHEGMDGGDDSEDGNIQDPFKHNITENKQKANYTDNGQENINTVPVASETSNDSGFHDKINNENSFKNNNASAFQIVVLDDNQTTNTKIYCKDESDTVTKDRLKILMKSALDCMKNGTFDYDSYGSLMAHEIKGVQEKTGCKPTEAQTIVLIQTIFGLTQLLQLFESNFQEQKSKQNSQYVQEINFSDYKKGEINSYSGTVVQNEAANKIVADPAPPKYHHQDKEIINIEGKNNYETSEKSYLRNKQDVTIPQGESLFTNPVQQSSVIPQRSTLYTNGNLGYKALPNLPIVFSPAINNNEKPQQFTFEPIIPGKINVNEGSIPQYNKQDNNGNFGNQAMANVPNSPAVNNNEKSQQSAFEPLIPRQMNRNDESIPQYASQDSNHNLGNQNLPIVPNLFSPIGNNNANSRQFETFNYRKN